MSEREVIVVVRMRHAWLTGLTGIAILRAVFHPHVARGHDWGFHPAREPHDGGDVGVGLVALFFLDHLDERGSVQELHQIESLELLGGEPLTTPRLQEGPQPAPLVQREREPSVHPQWDLLALAVLPPLPAKEPDRDAMLLLRGALPRHFDHAVVDDVDAGSSVLICRMYRDTHPSTVLDDQYAATCIDIIDYGMVEMTWQEPR